jgi:hypothetical protein
MDDTTITQSAPRAEGLKPPPVGSRFAVRERADGTMLCVARTERRYYTFEYRADGAWLCLWGSASSLDDALHTVDLLAALDATRWAEACSTRPSQLPA